MIDTHRRGTQRGNGRHSMAANGFVNGNAHGASAVLVRRRLKGMDEASEYMGDWEGE